MVLGKCLGLLFWWFLVHGWVGVFMGQGGLPGPKALAGPSVVGVVTGIRN